MQMRPETPRREIVRIMRVLAELMERALPRRVRADDIFLPWQTTSATLLARIARQGRTIALLLDSGHDLDAEMVMRSLLEHTTLFAWLAITPDDPSRQWRAREPDQNTLWWMIDQYRREKKLTEDQHTWLGGLLDDQMRSALRAMKQRVNAVPDRGQFPSVEEMATEVDAHWAPRLAGWQRAAPRTPGFAVTFRGHYWTLYTRGSSSVHPDYGAIRRFLRPPMRSGYQRHYLVPEDRGEQVDVVLSLTVFLMADALAVADAVLGWSTYDEALRVLGRWDEVRAPALLAGTIATLLNGQAGRHYGEALGSLVSVEMTAELLGIIVVDGGGWTRLTNQLGTNTWTLEDERRAPVSVGEWGPGLELGPQVLPRMELLARTEWSDPRTLRPNTWPAEVP